MLPVNAIELYQANIEDIESVIEIQIESHAHEINQVPDRALNILLINEYKKRWLQKLQNGMSIIIMKLDGQHIGFIAYTITENSAEIHNIYVISDFRRHKLGRMLCNSALEKMMQHSISKVSVWLVEGRKQIIKFYENMGFIATSQARIDNINQDLLLVEKRFELIINH